ncbi:MAG TPA: biotin--[acetyl-CoA-carboxylase] ligase [Candidatus Cybelea sp.]|jgi:BirA family biotin operon repressor/biotin-[acetyl-CoA-carboxylase] ligase|nr:biotin--[acetyl-CoA-carboxylase] ligase [Candidatus Cybelea sp.]
MDEVSKAGPYEGIAERLAGTPFASIAYVEETASTNADAAALLADERFAGHTIVAEYQSRGAARKGRTWTAPAGTALLFTTILPRALDARQLWVVPYWVALAVRNALMRFGVATTLQWPNDLLLCNRKLAGLLCQSSVSGASARVACGVGINVRRPPTSAGIEPAPAYCDEVATIQRAELLYAVLREYERTLPMLDQSGRVCHKWHEAAELPGKRYRILIDGSTEPFDAIAEGLAEGGGLRVLREGGNSETISLADARVLR